MHTSLSFVGIFAHKLGCISLQQKWTTIFVDRSSLWSNGLSFATPESDFSSASKVEHERSVEDHLPRWSETLSVASPESDFSSASKVEHERSVEDQLPRWSETLSFASPESDFTSCTDLELLNSVAEVYHQQALLNLRNIIFNVSKG